MIPNPYDLLPDTLQTTYLYDTLFFEKYSVKSYWPDNLDSPVENSFFIYGIDDNYEVVNDLDFQDLREAVLDRKKKEDPSPENFEYFLSRMRNLTPNRIRNIWAKEIGARFAVETMKGYERLKYMLKYYRDNFLPAHSRNQQVLITDDVINHIIKICKHVGLILFVTSDETATRSLTFEQPYPVYPTSADSFLYHGFYVEVFIDKLRQLYLLYLIWCYLYFYHEKADTEDRDNLLKEICSIRDSEITSRAFETQNDLPRLDSMEAVLSEISDSTRVFSYSRRGLTRGRKGGVEQVSKSDCMMSALRNQMIDLLFLGETNSDLKKKSLHNCEQCGKQFIRQNRKKRYCLACGTNAERARACRNKAKSQGVPEKQEEKEDSSAKGGQKH